MYIHTDYDGNLTAVILFSFLIHIQEKNRENFNVVFIALRSFKTGKKI